MEETEINDVPEAPKVKEKKAKKDKTKDKPTKRSKRVRAQPRDIEEFYAARAKEPEKFTIDTNGDLRAAPVKPGDIEKIFTLPAYRSLTLNEKIEADAKRRSNIMEAEQAVQDAQHALHEKITEFRNGDAYASDVVLANIDVTMKEKELQAKAWPLRKTTPIVSIPTNDILYNQPYEKRMMQHVVYKFKHYPYELQDIYGVESVAPEEAADETGEAPATTTEKAPMTTADRGRLGGILKVRRAKPTF